MTGNTIGEFIDDLLLMGGPEKEFVFRGRFYFLETLLNKTTEMLELTVDEYKDYRQENEKHICTYRFSGKTFAECVDKFELAAIFDGMTIYQAEREIDVLFG